MRHGTTQHGQAWCASCNRWQPAANVDQERLFVVEHAHGTPVAERLAARRELLAKLAGDERLAVGVHHARAIARQNARALEQWRVA